jgi:SET domain-containing protein
MLQVRTYLDKSPISDIGLFAAEDIPKGTITWEFYEDIDVVLEEFALNRIEFEFITKYSFYDKQLNKWILSADNDRFTNQSDNPNTAPLPDGKMIAVRDIKKGEEITSDYYAIDYDANLKFCKTQEQ